MEKFIISHGMTSHMLLHPMFCFYSLTSTQICLLVQLIIEQSQISLLSTETLPFWITLFMQCLSIPALLICLPLHVRSRQEQAQLFLHVDDICWRLQWASSKIRCLGGYRSHRSIDSHLFSPMGMRILVFSFLDEVFSAVHLLHLLPKYFWREALRKEDKPGRQPRT